MVFRTWQDLSFRVKLIIFSGLITSISLVLAGAAMLGLETRAIKHEYQRTAQTLAEVATRNCASALVFDDQEFAARILRGLEAEPGLQEAVIFDADGDIFAEWTRIGTEPGLGPPPENQLGFQSNTLRLVQPVLFNGQEVGSLYLVAEPTIIADRARLLTVWILVLFGMIFLGSLVLANSLQRGLSAPLDELQRTVDRVRRVRDYSVRARRFGNDELGRLTEAVNEMLVEIQRRDEALRASETRYSALLGRINEVVFRIAADTGELEFCSPGARALFGWDSSDLVANPGLLVSLVHVDSRPGFEAMLAEARAGRVLANLEYKIISRDGQEKWINQRNYPVYDDKGKLKSMEGFFFEVTERVKAAREKEHLHKELQQAHKLEALGTLSGGIAHDFNNILGAIMGYASLAQEEIPPDHPHQEFLRPILKASERASKLTKQILTFSRQGNPEQKPVDLGHIVHEALTLIRASLPATINIQHRVPEDLPLVLADPTQLHQVIMNLCTNAQHAMREAGGLLELELAAVDLDKDSPIRQGNLEPGPYLRLTISDTGVGIPQEDLPRIFEPFFTTKPEGEGTGMGLSVVYGIMREHGGSIAVESETGVGTRFVLLLPALQDTRTARSEEPRALEEVSADIIVVDDEIAVAEIITRMLERMGCRVQTFSNPHLALQAFRKDPQSCDMLITDYTMPNIPGLELAREFLSLRPDLPVLLCTGNPTGIDRATLSDLKNVVLVSKPFQIRMFSQQVQRCLASR